MKATDLMIGDYIQDLAGDLCQVIVLDRQVAQVETLTGVHQGDTTRYLHEAEVVPLTPEIFEKSGFTLNEEENPIFTIRVYSIDADDVAVIQRPKGGWKFMYGKETNNQQNLFFGDGTFVCMPIQYVHQLQHALKLCGIEKEIIL